MRLGHDISRTLTLGLPLIGGQVLQVSIGMADTLMLGWYSVPALAAGTIGSTFLFSVFLLGAGFAFAVLPLASEAVGRDDPQGVRRATRMGLWLSSLFGLLSLPVFVWSGPILLALGQQPQVAADAQTYLRIAGLGLLPMLITMVLRSHLSALEHARITMWAVLAGALLNVGINWLLIYGNWGFPEMGVAGAAVASVCVNALMAAILLAYATRGPGMARYELLKNLHRPDWPVFARVFRIGWPIGLTHVSESGLFAASAVMMGWLGTVPLAAHGVAIQVASLVFMVHLGLANAVTVRVGQAWGRRDAAGVAAGGRGRGAALGRGGGAGHRALLRGGPGDRVALRRSGRPAGPGDPGARRASADARGAVPACRCRADHGARHAAGAAGHAGADGLRGVRLLGAGHPGELRPGLPAGARAGRDLAGALRGARGGGGRSDPAVPGDGAAGRRSRPRLIPVPAGPGGQPPVGFADSPRGISGQRKEGAGVSTPMTDRRRPVTSRS
jgi:MATE family multidrug resistance protein